MFYSDFCLMVFKTKDIVCDEICIASKPFCFTIDVIDCSLPEYAGFYKNSQLTMISEPQKIR